MVYSMLTTCCLNLHSLSCRVRREYLNLDIEVLLAENGITTDLLRPKPRKTIDEKTQPSDLVSPYLPLEVSPF